MLSRGLRAVQRNLLRCRTGLLCITRGEGRGGIRLLRGARACGWRGGKRLPFVRNIAGRCGSGRNIAGSLIGSGGGTPECVGGRLGLGLAVIHGAADSSETAPAASGSADNFSVDAESTGNDLVSVCGTATFSTGIASVSATGSVCVGSTGNACVGSTGNACVGSTGNACVGSTGNACVTAEACSDTPPTSVGKASVCSKSAGIASAFGRCRVIS